MLAGVWDAAGTVDPTARKFDESHMPLCRRPASWENSGKQSGLERVRSGRWTSHAVRVLWPITGPFLLGQGPPAPTCGMSMRPPAGAAARSEAPTGVDGGGCAVLNPARAWAWRGHGSGSPLTPRPRPPGVLSMGTGTELNDKKVFLIVTGIYC